MLKFVCFFFLLFFQFDFGSNAMVGGKSVLTYNDFMSSDYLLVRERLGSFLEKSNSNNLCGFCSLKRYVCGTKQVWENFLIFAVYQHKRLIYQGAGQRCYGLLALISI